MNYPMANNMNNEQPAPFSPGQLQRSWSNFGVKEAGDDHIRCNNRVGLARSPKSTRCKFATVYDEAVPSPPMMPVRQRSHRKSTKDKLPGTPFGQDTSPPSSSPSSSSSSLTKSDSSKTSKVLNNGEEHHHRDENPSSSCRWSNDSLDRKIIVDHAPAIPAGILKNNKKKPNSPNKTTRKQKQKQKILKQSSSLDVTCHDIIESSIHHTRKDSPVSAGVRIKAASRRQVVAPPPRAGGMHLLATVNELK